MILLKRTMIEGDSPIKVRVRELEQQFERRKHRMDLFDIRNCLIETMNNETALTATAIVDDTMKEVDNNNEVDDFVNFVSTVNTTSI